MSSIFASTARPQTRPYPGLRTTPPARRGKNDGRLGKNISAPLPAALHRRSSSFVHPGTSRSGAREAIGGALKNRIERLNEELRFRAWVAYERFLEGLSKEQ